MIARPAHLAALRRKLEANPVVALLGARQVGKTTLADMLARTLDETPGPATRFDLEDPRISLGWTSSPSPWNRFAVWW